MLVTEGNKIEQTVLARLKSATKALHARIDAHLPLAARDVSKDAYTAHVQLLLAWLGALAPPIARGHDGLAEFAAAGNQASLALLAQDVRAAGLAAPSAAPADSHPDLARPAFRWGMQYVIEGSYMGAGVLYKRLAPQWPDCPMFFFSHVAAAKQERWSRFAGLIEQAVAGEDAIVHAEHGAIHAFDCFMKLSQDTQPSRSPSLLPSES